MILRLLRYCLKAATAVSLVLWVAVAALWVWTEAVGRNESFTWGERGVHRCLEFWGDDVDYKVLRDPGFAAAPVRWHHRRGWVMPPRPSNPAALPPGSSVWVLPPPGSNFPATSHGGVRDLGFEYDTFAG